MGLEIGLVVSPQAPPEQQWAPTQPVGEKQFPQGRGRDRDRNPGKRAELGRAEDSGASGGQEILLGKISPAIRPAHPQGPWRVPDSGQLTYPEKRKRISQGTPQCTQRHAQRTTGNHTEMCGHSDPATRPPGTRVYRCAHTHTCASLCLTACHSPPALAHYQSSSWQGPPGAHT